jgi:hypothetical protein
MGYAKDFSQFFKCTGYHSAQATGTDIQLQNIHTYTNFSDLINTADRPTLVSFKWERADV